MLIYKNYMNDSFKPYEAWCESEDFESVEHGYGMSLEAAGLDYLEKANDFTDRVLTYNKRLQQQGDHGILINVI